MAKQEDAVLEDKTASSSSSKNRSKKSSKEPRRSEEREEGELEDEEDESHRYSDGFADDLMGDDKDRHRLSSLDDKERERELQQRLERREELRQKYMDERRARDGRRESRRDSKSRSSHHYSDRRVRRDDKDGSRESRKQSNRTSDDGKKRHSPEWKSRSGSSSSRSPSRSRSRSRTRIHRSFSRSRSRSRSSGRSYQGIVFKDYRRGRGGKFRGGYFGGRFMRGRGRGGFRGRPYIHSYRRSFTRSKSFSRSRSRSRDRSYSPRKSPPIDSPSYSSKLSKDQLKDEDKSPKHGDSSVGNSMNPADIKRSQKQQHQSFLAMLEEKQKKSRIASVAELGKKLGESEEHHDSQRRHGFVNTFNTVRSPDSQLKNTLSFDLENDGWQVIDDAETDNVAPTRQKSYDDLNKMDHYESESKESRTRSVIASEVVIVDRSAESKQETEKERDRTRERHEKPYSSSSSYDSSSDDDRRRKRSSKKKDKKARKSKRDSSESSDDSSRDKKSRKTKKRKDDSSSESDVDDANKEAEIEDNEKDEKTVSQDADKETKAKRKSSDSSESENDDDKSSKKRKKRSKKKSKHRKSKKKRREDSSGSESESSDSDSHRKRKAKKKMKKKSKSKKSRKHKKRRDSSDDSDSEAEMEFDADPQPFDMASWPRVANLIKYTATKPALQFCENPRLLSGEHELPSILNSRETSRDVWAEGELPEMSADGSNCDILTPADRRAMEKLKKKQQKEIEKEEAAKFQDEVRRGNPMASYYSVKKGDALVKQETPEVAETDQQLPSKSSQSSHPDSRPVDEKKQDAKDLNEEKKKTAKELLEKVRKKKTEVTDSLKGENETKEHNLYPTYAIPTLNPGQTFGADYNWYIQYIQSCGLNPVTDLSAAYYAQYNLLTCGHYKQAEMNAWLATQNCSVSDTVFPSKTDAEVYDKPNENNVDVDTSQSIEKQPVNNSATDAAGGIEPGTSQKDTESNVDQAKPIETIVSRTPLSFGDILLESDTRCSQSPPPPPPPRPQMTELMHDREIELPNGSRLPAGTKQIIVHPYPPLHPYSDKFAAHINQYQQLSQSFEDVNFKAQTSTQTIYS